jgi:hypothetical protein
MTKLLTILGFAAAACYLWALVLEIKESQINKRDI